MKRILLSAVATLALTSTGLAQTVTIGNSDLNTNVIVNANSGTFVPAGTAPNAGALNRTVSTLTYANSEVFTQQNFDQWVNGSFTRVERVSPATGGTNVNNYRVATYQWGTSITGDIGGGSVYVGNPDDPNGLSPGSLRDVFGAPQNLASIIDGEDGYDARFLTSYQASDAPTAGASVTTTTAGVFYAFDLKFKANHYVDVTKQGVDVTILERGKNSTVRVAALDAAGNVISGSERLVNFSGRPTLFPIDTSEADVQDVAGVGINFDPTVVTKIYGVRIQYDNLSGANNTGPDIVAVGAAIAVPEPATFAQAAMGAFGASIMGLTVVRRRRRVVA